MKDAKDEHDLSGWRSSPQTPRPTKIRIEPSKPDYPRSCAANHEPPAPLTSEKDLLEAVKRDWRSSSDSDATAQISRRRRKLIIVDLVNFEIYRCPKSDRRRASELTSLHLFDVKAKNLCFDGYVQLEKTMYYVERVKVEDMSIEGCGSDSKPGIIAYLQTSLANRDATSDIWLRLREPAPRYERFHSPFLWIAVLGKHAIDYLDDQPRGTIGLENFKFSFHRWLRQRFGSNKSFRTWFKAFNNTTDFRVAFNAHAEFFYNQALNLSSSRHLTSHPIWSHCKCDRMLAVARQPALVKETLTTPHVYQSFKQMYFASKLKQVSPSKLVSQLQKNRKSRLGFPEECTTRQPTKHCEKNSKSTSHIQLGDVVSIVPDHIDKTHWQKSDGEWLAYVQGIEPNAQGAQRLVVLWLYRPADTNICLAHYPIANELFLSDNCNCKEREILLTDVIRKHTVEWLPRTLNTNKDFIVRQTYMTSDSAFVTVRDDHKICPCRKSKPKVAWSAGDAVYITKITNGQRILEPVVVHEIDYEAKEVKVRTLLRLGRDRPALARQAKRKKILPNELVLTGRLKTVSLSRIQRACNVRFIPLADVIGNRIPSPYNLRGAGDYWFISMGFESVNGIESLIVLEQLPRGFRETREAPLTCKKLRGLSLFSGGGGLDRGLEEGGAVEFQTSVDYDSAAIHTQRANCKDPQKMRLFCGSVDDYLHSLLSGDNNRLVARVGEVDLIAAGSPCPGFSSLQQKMLSQQSLTHASHVTTFCTTVDVYRPLYGVLENVVNMASTRTGFEEQNVLSQLVACLVSMGYQVNQYIMDSWTYGSCQRRSRIILTIAAPGLEPLLQRPHTHSRSYEATSARSLGKLPNGERFGDREHYATPFPYVSAKAATSDLPDIGNGNVQGCIPFPDHRLSRPTNSKIRALVECIPKTPPGFGYAEAMERQLVPPCLRMTKMEVGRAYQRIKADGLVPTITTVVNMQDARNGASVHWSQHRPLSIQEVRRTQGYPDHEPIIGTLNEQWKILGNGVDRKVSFSIGLALRDALFKFKDIPLSSDLEDDAEAIVDLEDETKDYWPEQPKVESLPAGPPSISSASTDSFSSTKDLRRSFDVSVVIKVKPRPADSSPASPSEHSKEGKPLASRTTSPREQFKESKQAAPSESFLSRLSRQVTGNVGMFSLPIVPSYLHSRQPIKRQREESGDERKDVPLTDAGPVKRLKVVDTRRTTSPAVDTSNGDVKFVIRRASLPPSGKITHTRSSGSSAIRAEGMAQADRRGQQRF